MIVMNSYTIMLLILFLSLSYYWWLHPFLIIIYGIVFRSNNRALLIRAKKTRDKSSLELYTNKTDVVYMVIPTFGRRRVIIEKILFLDDILSRENFINKLIKKVIIIYSKPDKHVLEELRSVIENNVNNKDKYLLLIEASRRGKAAAINTAINYIDNNIENNKDYVVIVNDDDLFFNHSSIQKGIQILRKDSRIGLVSIAPRYSLSSANLFYFVKRAVHILEEKMCAPAAVYGDFIFLRRKAISSLEENSLAEDLQLCLKVLVNGFKAKLINGDIYENYPQTIKGIMNRTKRTLYGSFIEYKRFIRQLYKTTNLSCAYVFSAYMLNLLFLPFSLLLLILLLITIVYQLFLVLSTVELLVFFALAGSLLVIFKDKLASSVKFILAIMIGSILGIMDILKSLLFSKMGMIDFEKAWIDAKDVKA